MKTKLLLLLLIVVFTTANLRAADFTVDSIAYTITSATAPYTVAVAQKSTVYTGAVTIPTSVSYNSINYSVTSIGVSAFYNCTGLTTVTIPNSVNTIGTSAFSFCKGLTSVTIPNSVTSIGDGAFSGCKGLTSVTIPNSVTSIRDNAFAGCSGLTSVTIPSLVTTIGNSAFWYCTGLTSVTIPNSVTSIGTYAFQGCTGLTSVTIPNSVTTIGGRAFYFCDGLTSVNIPASVTTIGDRAFYGCIGLTSVNIPASVTTIWSEAFSLVGSIDVDSNNPNYSSIDGVLYNKGQSILIHCPKSKTGSFVIPSSVTSIASTAFIGCENLTTVIIPNSVTSIGAATFQGCTGLTSVTIGNSVTSIGDYAFYNCNGLTSIYADRPTPVNLGSPGVFSSVNTTTCTLYVPTGSKSFYAAANQWKDFTNIVERVVTGIATVSASKLNIRVMGLTVEISLLEASTPVQVVDINGRQLYNGKPTGSTLSVTLPQAGVYLVRTGNKTAKLVVK